MSHISKPVDWEVFNIPPRQPIQYFSILKKKRDFMQFIKQYDAQVLKHEYLHYCSIMPKNSNSSMNNKYELLIVFFDDVPNTSFIGFRVIVNKETFLHESNSLLLFLKKSKKAGYYLMNNNCIHVQCGTNAWELFYCLYDTYLRQYVLTVIGTKFFYHFVYSYFIKKEIQLHEMLFKGSKIIRISKKSIYYKIHKKRKISLMDLIHMTYNMPKRKKCVISSFNDKKSLFHSDFESRNLYTSVGSKIHVSKLMLKRFKKQCQDTTQNRAATNRIALENFQVVPKSAYDPKLDSLLIHNVSKADVNNMLTYSNNASLKRKFGEIANEESVQPSPISSKFLKISETACQKEVDENHWNSFAHLKPYNIKSYSDIPCLKVLVPNLLNNGSTSTNIDSSENYLYNEHNHLLVQSSMLPSVSLEKITNWNTISDCLTVEETCEIDNSMNGKKDETSTVKHGSTFSIECSKKASVLTISEQNSSTSIEPHIHIPSGENYHLPPPLNMSGSIRDSKASTLSLSTFDNLHPWQIKSPDVDFTTAAGKSITISKSALLKAQKLTESVYEEENQGTLPKKIICDPNKKFKKSHGFKNDSYKSAVNYMPLNTTSVTSGEGKNLKVSKNSSKSFDVNISEKTQRNFEPDDLDTPDLENVTFSTAAGRAINVSNTAMQAAHKLFQDVLKEEKIVISSSKGNYQNQNFKDPSSFKNIGCPPKKSSTDEMDVDMDKTLVEKFFEDSPFDEKEWETPSTSKNDENTEITVEPENKNLHLPIRKPRKSLGGRRSMRFCSDTL